MVKLSQFVPSSPLQTKNAPFVPTILVVDDEPLIADTLVTILRANGYIASAVYNGEQAIKFAALLPPDIVITDLMMPGMNGIDLAVALKEQLPDCAVLLFSGHAQAARLVADPRYAKHNFPLLAKPLHPEQLLAYISSLIETAGSIA